MRCRYGAHLADWSPARDLYAYAGQNSVVLLDTSTEPRVAATLWGHTNRCVRTHSTEGMGVQQEARGLAV